MKNMMGMMKQVGEMQARVQQMQEELAALEIDGQSGGGLVMVTLTGKGDMKKVRIDPSLVKPGEAEIIEDLIVAAMADAKVEARCQIAGQDAGGDRRAAAAARVEAVLGGRHGSQDIVARVRRRRRDPRRSTRAKAMTCRRRWPSPACRRALKASP